jgi:hypothetical protein
VRRFYDAIMTALGASKVYDRPTALGYGERCTPDDTSSTYLAVYLDPGRDPQRRAARSEPIDGVTRRVAAPPR